MDHGKTVDASTVREYAAFAELSQGHWARPEYLLHREPAGVGWVHWFEPHFPSRSRPLAPASENSLEPPALIHGQGPELQGLHCLEGPKWQP